MENQLMDLKKSMDNTILKNGTISTSEKQKILRAALENKERNKRYFFAPVFSFLLIASFFMTIGVYVYNESIVTNQTGSKNTKSTVAGKPNIPSDNSKVDADNNINNEKLTTASTNTSTFTVNYPYIVLNGYYYKKTDEEVPVTQIGGKIGEVKRIGDWSIKQSGDSNEIPPGPIYSIKGKNKDVFIAGKGVVKKDGINKSGYLEFERADPVEKVDSRKILSSKGDVHEVQIAFENVKSKVGTLYGFRGIDSIASLFAISYEDGRPFISQTYNVPQGNTKSNQQEIPGVLFVIQYKKEAKLENSRFIRPKNYEFKNGEKAYEMEQRKIDNWKSPNLIDSFDANGISWGIYKDTFYKDFVLNGRTSNFNIEITIQGDFTIEQLKDLMGNFKE